MKGRWRYGLPTTKAFNRNRAGYIRGILPPRPAALTYPAPRYRYKKYNTLFASAWCVIDIGQRHCAAGKTSSSFVMHFGFSISFLEQHRFGVVVRNESEVGYCWSTSLVTYTPLNTEHSNCWISGFSTRTASIGSFRSRKISPSAPMI